MLMIGKELSVQQRLHKAVVDIMASSTHAAIAPVLMIGSKTIDSDTPTAYTDGLNEVYGEKFVSGLSDAEFRFLVLHETYHKLYQHLTTWRNLYDEDPQLANMACDYVINIKLIDADATGGVKGFIKLPKGGLCDERYRDMTAAQVFNALRKEGKGGRGDSSGDGKGAPMDSHGWEEAKAMSEQDRKQLQRDLDSAIRQGSILASKNGTGGDRLLGDLLQAQVDWREQLREFVQTTCTGNDFSTWRRPNRRYVGMGHYLPSGVSEVMGELVVAIDTSGSIGARELSSFLSELASICEIAKPEKLRLVYWDTAVAAEEVYEQDQVSTVVSSTKPRGGGGTLIECVCDHLVEKNVKPQAVIVFTDGYLGGSWGTWTSPVMWCLLDNKRTVAPVGKTVHIETNTL